MLSWAGNWRGKKQHGKLDWHGYLFILPILAVLVFLDFSPLAYGIYYSLTDFSLLHIFNYSYVGARNYYIILFENNPSLATLIWQTFVWSGGSIILMSSLGFMLALLMNQPGIRGTKLYRTIYLFPWAYPAFITILIWKGLLDYNLGFINKVLAMVGVEKVYWLGLSSTSMFSMILVNLWLSFPYYTFVYTAALQSVPKELYDAARIDGYGTTGTVRKVALPLLKRQISFVTIFGFIFTWNNFYIPFLLTGGGPGTSTYILITYAYNEVSIAYPSWGLASAYAMINVLILLVFVILINKFTRMMSVVY
ncbi:MAG: sugar ABC transporter permease [Candidatus Thermoplasmatota archaeon]|nr:sugar ABC transporter permease [Candidatus Thermoplasmatota archaeon]MCL5438325.1 sugar ABC transporter permease [Candidatus Thermoplasmatota archaeon]